MIESNFTIFKRGMLFGFGFFVPIIFALVTCVGAYSLTHKNQSVMIDGESPSMSIHNIEGNKHAAIEVLNFRDMKSGNYTYIVGSYKNTSNDTVRSFTVEAEFFDKDGNFVWQEHESIYKNVEPNEVQNFAIKCGCRDHSIPEYSKVTVKAIE